MKIHRICFQSIYRLNTTQMEEGDTKPQQGAPQPSQLSLSLLAMSQCQNTLTITALSIILYLHNVAVVALSQQMATQKLMSCLPYFPVACHRAKSRQSVCVCVCVRAELSSWLFSPSKYSFSDFLYMAVQLGVQLNWALHEEHPACSDRLQPHNY